MQQAKIGIFGRHFDVGYDAAVEGLMRHLEAAGVQLWVYRPFLDVLRSRHIAVSGRVEVFDDYETVPPDLLLMMSIGGDGTFLHSVRMVRSSSIPIVGINAGRLGFLADVPVHDLLPVTDRLLAGDFVCEERALLQVSSDSPLFGDYNCALNEMTVQKSDTSLLTVQVWCDGDYLTTYWADGLIVSTPTGSSAYSLSVGGPIVSPVCRNFILSPIAAHNLNERPLILPDSVKLRLCPESRSGSVQITLDSRSVTCASGVELFVERAPYMIKVVKGGSFFASLRSKLMWGADKRN